MTKRQIILLAIVLAIACVLPFVVSNYRTFQFTLVIIYAIALLGLNLFGDGLRDLMDPRLRQRAGQ